MKNNGYKIIAAEQAVNSVKLHETDIPFKSVLVLG